MKEYWLNLQQQYQQLAARVNQVVLRERVLLLVVLLVLIYALWTVLIESPQSEAINLAKAEEAMLVKQIEQLQQKITDIEKNIAALSANMQSLGTKPGSELVSGSTVVPMFKSLLAKQRKITLKEVNNIPSKLWDLPANAELSGHLYEQGVNLVFEGNYLGFYEYLQSLESLKWMIFWDELQYVVTDYPKAEIRLTIYTVNRGQEK